MRTLEEVQKELQDLEDQLQIIWPKQQALETERTEIQKAKLLSSGILSKQKWLQIESKYGITLYLKAQSYQPKAIFELFAWEHGIFDLGDGAELSVSDGELYFRFNDLESFRKWDAKLQFDISYDNIDKKLTRLEEKVTLLKSLKAR